MEDRNNCGSSIGPLKSKSDIHEDADQGGKSYCDRFVAKLRPGYGADRISTNDLVSGIWGSVQISLGGRLGTKRIERLSYFISACIDLCLRFALSLQRQFYQHRIRLVGELDDGILDTLLCKCGSDCFICWSLLEPHRNNGAALKINAKVKSLMVGNLPKNRRPKTRQHQQD